MSDLSEFLSARLDDVEVLAKAASNGWEGVEWESSDRDHGGISVYPPSVHEPDGEYEFETPITRHIAAHDPAFTLAWVAALRRVVALHARVDEGVWPPEAAPACNTCGEWGEYPEGWPCPTLRALASAFKAHPEWREEWA